MSNSMTLTKTWPRDRAAEFFKLLQQMSPLSHYPDRSQPYCDEKSEVLAHIKAIYDVSDFDTARRIFDTATRARVIMFDRETKLWKGNPFWKHSLKGIGKDDNVLDRYDVRHRVRGAALIPSFKSLPSLKQRSIKKRISDALASGKSKAAVREMLEQFGFSWYSARQLCRRYTRDGRRKVRKHSKR
jgi:hypothetical protein